MSKHETPMVRWYWEEVRGTLIEEFVAVHRAADRGQRIIDAIILHDGKHRIIRTKDFDRSLIAGMDITIVQAKVQRLGPSQMGQALFAIGMMEQYEPASIMSVVLCTEDDAFLRPMVEAHEGLKVVVCPAEFVPR